MAIHAGNLCRVKDNNLDLLCFVLAKNDIQRVTFCEVIPLISTYIATKDSYAIDNYRALYMKKVFIVVSDVLKVIGEVSPEQCEDIVNLHIAMHLENKQYEIKYGKFGYADSTAPEYFPTLEAFEVHHMYSSIIQGYFFKE